ncbi:PucR family transcriptional regulator [Nocardia arizonensis]|uniref:PucR family transcriptional regulator n=1 Tax=Nocardia arizonensis TaxID=1141647 RepID=UPI00138F3B63|nr:helix-turn-helix domain-containing protein [Nocardia arizonensis]
MLNTVFDLTKDPDELQNLLHVITWSIGDFVENTAARAMELMRAERSEILRGSRPELRETVALVLDGAPITLRRAESKLGYRLEQTHTAVIVWSAEPDVGLQQVDVIVENLGGQRNTRPLIVMPGASTKWVWLPGTADIDREQLRAAVNPSGSIQVAVGGRAPGVEGFRRSHLEAVAAQRMVARLESPQRVVFFDEIQLVALLTNDADGAQQFLRQTLGDLAQASPEIRETVLAFVEESGSVGRVAARVYAHRNTVLRRMARAETLLPDRWPPTRSRWLPLCRPCTGRNLAADIGAKPVVQRAGGRPAPGSEDRPTRSDRTSVGYPCRRPGGLDPPGRPEFSEPLIAGPADVAGSRSGRGYDRRGDQLGEVASARSRAMGLRTP